MHATTSMADSTESIAFAAYTSEGSDEVIHISRQVVLRMD